MKIKSAFAIVSVLMVSIALNTPQAPVELPQQTFLTILPADADLEFSGEKEKQPLLLAGNTACNPRVTVCEE